MKFLVIGSGMMGSALAYDLAHSSDIEAITLADADLQRAKATADWIKSENVRPVRLDVEYFDDVIALMEGHDCAIAATSFRHNYELTKAALEAGVHFCDLGGNDDVVQRQRDLDAKANERNLLIVPNCGLAPGLANVLAARGAEQFETVDSIFIRVGGLPQHPKPPLNYQLSFSVEGLLNEYSGTSVTLRDYKRVEIDTMTEIERIEFPPPFGALEAFHTSGGTSLLAEMFEGKVRELDYKTIRYAGHCGRFKALLDVGFASNEPITVGTNLLTARELFVELLKRKLSGSDPDAVLVRVTVRGVRAGKQQTLTFNLVDFYQENDNISAMMRVTAFPTSIIAQEIVRGTIRNRGVHTPEQCVPLDPLIAELQKRDIRISQEWN